MAYSLIACQAAYLAAYYPSVYWNTAYLRVVSGMEESSTTNYEKIAKGIGAIKSHGVNVGCVDINKSSYYFEPDESTNSILYGMKALSDINGDIVSLIEGGRPFSSVEDFCQRVEPKKAQMISLIKAGAFDQFGDRRDIMKNYIEEKSDLKSRLTMQNMEGLLDKGLVPAEFDLQRRTYVFNKSLRANCKYGDYYSLERRRYYTFYEKFFDLDQTEVVDGKICVRAKTWQKMYTKAMEPLKKYIADNQEALLDAFNSTIFQAQWDKYADGSVSKWEMDSMGFYSSGHELDGMDFEAYGISSFNSLPETPEPTSIVRNKYPIYELTRIAGTVIAKDDIKGLFTLLTPQDGPVDVRMPRDLYTLYNRRLSEVMPDGTKKVVEDGWFSRGNLLMVCGFRRNNTFVAKRYKNTPSSMLYKITKVNGRTVELTDCRVGDECDEEV